MTLQELAKRINAAIQNNDTALQVIVVGDSSQYELAETEEGDGGFVLLVQKVQG
jgi:hypothetical protein